MYALTAAELIEAWGGAYGASPPRQALALLAAACPEWDAARLARLTVGQRDGLLLALREEIFGPHVEAYVRCPRCGEAVELAFEVADVRVKDAPPPEHGPPGPFTLEAEGYDVTFRVPDSTDLLALAAADCLRGPEEGCDALFERSILSVNPSGRPPETPAVPAPETAGAGTAAVDVDALDAATRTALCAAVDAALEEVDPQADVELALACPCCDHAWEAPFDIELYLWSELTTWAQRTLQQVHALASAYGWREAEILGLPAWRRQYYLEMVGV